MTGFVGRDAELRQLDRLLDEARTGGGVLVSMRGRRQVGKSRLVAEFVNRAAVPAVHFTASRQPSAVERAAFFDAARTGGVEAVASLGADAIGSWEAALLLATADATSSNPVIVVIDELPYLIESDPAIEAILQKVWATLERRPVLMILIGSDLSMMSALTEYGRPLYGRAREVVIRPLSVAEVAQMTGSDARAALDAYLVIGGFPRLVQCWRSTDTVASFVRREFRDESSPLVISGERVVSAELPSDLPARAVLQAVGAGERSYAAIGQRSGVQRGQLDRTLATLIAKGLVRRSVPYGVGVGGRFPHYAIADEYLRFWLRFVAPGLEEMLRGRADLAVRRLDEGWLAYRGRAIEPLVRASVERMLPDTRLGDAAFVGGFWTRDGSVEVDLVGGPTIEALQTIEFVGSIKWRERKPFNREDLAALQQLRTRVPGADDATPLVGVSRNGFDVDGLDVMLGPDELVDAWARP